MRSLPNIFKPGSLVHTEHTVLIPDIPEPPAPEIEEGGPAEETADFVEFRPPVITESDRLAGEEFIRHAQQEGMDIVEAAQREAEQIRTRAYQEAYEKGLSDGLEEKRQDISGCIHSVEVLMDELQASLDEFIGQYEREVRDLVIEITDKIITKRLLQDDMELAGLVKQAVSSVKKADWIKVEISDQLPELLEYLQGELSLNSYGSTVEVQAKNVPAGTCVVQTPEGLIDASVPVQLDQLRERFEEIP